jgi:antitoxin CptB
MSTAGKAEIMDLSQERGRLRWHCRRGLLELDLVFTRFLEKHFDSLDGDGLKALQELLAFEDTDLWPMISGRKECEKPHLRGLIALLRAP